MTCSLLLSLSACSTMSASKQNNYGNITIESLLERGQKDSTTRTVLVKQTIQRASNDLKENKPKSALKHANLALRFNPENPDAQLMAGKAALANQDYQTAIKYLKPLTTQKPEGEVFELLGVSQFFQGDYDAAKQNLRGALERDPDLWRANVILARIENNQGQTELADNLFAEAMNKTDKQALVYDHQGYALKKRGKLTDAVQAFETAQSLSNNVYGNHDTYRLAKAQSGAINSVIQNSTSSELGRLYRSLGREALNSGDKIQAIKFLKKAMMHFPKHDQETADLIGSVQLASQAR